MLGTLRPYSDAWWAVHDEIEAEVHGAPPGRFTQWREFEPGSDHLFYEGLHGAVVTDTVDVARYVDLKIGVVPVINLEWIQKIHRDCSARGHCERSRPHQAKAAEENRLDVRKTG